MRLLLRFIAVYTAASVIATAISILSIWRHGGMPYLFHGGALEALTIAGWIATIALGTPAALLLWRRQNIGRILAAISWAAVCAYYVYAVLFWPNGRLILPLIGSGVLATFLFSPIARRACNQPDINEQSLPQN